MASITHAPNHGPISPLLWVQPLSPSCIIHINNANPTADRDVCIDDNLFMTLEIEVAGIANGHHASEGVGGQFATVNGQRTGHFKSLD